MRSGWLRVLALSLLWPLCGCRESRTNTAAAPTEGRPTLTFFGSLTEIEWQVMREEVFAPFEREHGCSIVGVDVVASEMSRKLSALAQSGQMNVDLIGQDNMALAVLVQSGLMQDLSDFVPELPAATMPSLLEVGRFEGHQFFVPFRPNVEIAFYDQSHFDKRGLQPPHDWPELLAVAKAFKAAEGVGRVAIKADTTTIHLIDFINAAGGNPLTLNDEGTAAAFDYLKELWPYLSPESRRADSNTMNQFLAMESVYLAQNWTFGIEVIVRQGEKTNVKAYQGWRGPKREAHTLGGDVFGIPVGAPHAALARELIRFTQSVPVQAALMRRLAWPSMRADAYAEVEPWQQPYFEAVSKALEHAIARPNVTYWEVVDKSLRNAFREAVVQGADTKATLDKYAAVIAAARVRAQQPRQ